MCRNQKYIRMIIANASLDSHIVHMHSIESTFQMQFDPISLTSRWSSVRSAGVLISHDGAFLSPLLAVDNFPIQFLLVSNELKMHKQTTQDQSLFIWWITQRKSQKQIQIVPKIDFA